MVNPLPTPTKEEFLGLVRELLGGKGLAARRREGEAIAVSLAEQDGVTRALVYRLLQILHPPKRKGSDQTAPGRDSIKHRTITRQDPILEIIVGKGWDPGKHETRALVAKELNRIRQRGDKTIDKRTINSTLVRLAAVAPVLKAKYAILKESGIDDPKTTGKNYKWLKDEIRQRCPDLSERTIAAVLANEVGNEDA
jgi:hypothetical protein